MKTIDALIESEYTGWGEEKQYTAFMLAELIGPAATYRFTDAPLAVVWAGHTWSNVSFKLSPLTIDGNGDINTSVAFEDASQTIRALAFANDLNTFELKIYEVWADEDAVIFGEDLVVHGACDGVSCTGEDSPYPEAVIALKGVYANSGVTIGPLQDYSRNCPYPVFKGPECKYVGAETTCNRTFTQCSAYSNWMNFGGMRYALLEDMTVTWGTGSGKTTRRPAKAYEPPPATPTKTPVVPTKRRAVRS